MNYVQLARVRRYVSGSVVVRGFLVVVGTHGVGRQPFVVEPQGIMLLERLHRICVFTCRPVFFTRFLS